MVLSSKKEAVTSLYILIKIAAKELLFVITFHNKVLKTSIFKMKKDISKIPTFGIWRCLLMSQSLGQRDIRSLTGLFRGFVIE